MCWLSFIGEFKLALSGAVSVSYDVDLQPYESGILIFVFHGIACVVAFGFYFDFGGFAGYYVIHYAESLVGSDRVTVFFNQRLRFFDKVVVSAYVDKGISNHRFAFFTTISTYGFTLSPRYITLVSVTPESMGALSGFPLR